MAALKALGWVALVHAPGLSEEAATRLGEPLLRFEPRPVQTDAAVAAADVVVSHASVGLIAPAGASPADASALLTRLTSTAAYGNQAQALAARHQGMRPAQSAVRLADLIEATLPGRF